MADQLFPNAAALDQGALTQLALALDALGKTDQAVRVLEENGKRLTQSDALGVLAGRLKRLWLATREEPLYESARENYSRALEIAQGLGDDQQIFYAAINIAFLDALHAPANSARPESVTRHAKIAEEAATRCRPGIWRDATLGEAALLLGEPDRSIHHYKSALSAARSPREVDSIFQQVSQIVEASYRKDKRIAPLLSLFTKGG